jgi:hypothetical protein
MGGDGNSADVTNVDAVPAMLEISAIEFGSNWGGHVSGQTLATVPSSISSTFTGGSTAGVHAIAVEFQGAIITVPADPFDDWIVSFPDLTDTDQSLDFDAGGLETGIEWVLGGDPTDASDDAGLAPTLDNTTDPNGKLLFTFRRADNAAADSDTAIAVEYGNNLMDWTAATHEGVAADEITITTIDDGFATGVDAVTVALPLSEAVDGCLFVRLSVTITNTP